MKQKSHKKYQTPEARVVPIALESVLLEASTGVKPAGPSANFMDDPDLVEEDESEARVQRSEF